MLQRISFAISFMHLQLRRGHKEDDMEVDEARRGMDYRTVRIMSSLEGWCPLRGVLLLVFQRLTWMPKNNGQDWLKIFHQRSYRPGVWLPTMTWLITAPPFHPQYSQCNNVPSQAAKGQRTYNLLVLLGQNTYPILSRCLGIHNTWSILVHLLNKYVLNKLSQALY